VFERLERRGALGATDLARAFDDVGALARARSFRRVILVSDGIVTAGHTRDSSLVASVSGWAKAGIRRFDVVAPPGVRNDALLGALVTSNLPERGLVVTTTDQPLTRLQLATLPDIEVSVLGATAQAPRILRGPTPGERAWVYARVPEGTELRVQVGTAPPRTVPSHSAFYPLLERVFPRIGISVPTNPKRGWLGERFEILDGKMVEKEIHTSAPIVRCGDPTYVTGRLPPESIQRIIRMNFGRFRGCYADGLLSHARLSGRVVVRFVIGWDGQVTSVQDQGSTLANRDVTRCIMEGFTKLTFPTPAGGSITVVYPLVLTQDGKLATDLSEGPPPNFEPVTLSNPEYPLLPRDVGTEAYEGPFATVMQALQDERSEDARLAVESFARSNPGEPLPLLARGQVAESQGDIEEARRAYGSLIDLFPEDARLRRVASSRLERLSDPLAGGLAIDSLEKALTLEGGRALTQRQLGWMWVKRGQYQKALDRLTAAVQAPKEDDGETLPALLRQDIGMVARALLAQHPGVHASILRQLKLTGIPFSSEKLLRFVLMDESEDQLTLGLYANPEKGRLLGTRIGDGHAVGYLVSPSERRAPYTIRARNVVGSRFHPDTALGLGYVEIVQHDGKGRLTVETRPFVIMTEPSELDLGTFGN
jgi:hypothetical protein